ncbi:MAG TPA: hypothetical protein VM582_02635 [Candidatus Thermoplasmatota archaeon]|nr:hypothetical protein [Candidatus Thermoplasmatota archaeon]
MRASTALVLVVAALLPTGAGAFYDDSFHVAGGGGFVASNAIFHVDHHHAQNRIGIELTSPPGTGVSRWSAYFVTYFTTNAGSTLGAGFKDRVGIDAGLRGLVACETAAGSTPSASARASYYIRVIDASASPPQIVLQETTTAADCVNNGAFPLDERRLVTSSEIHFLPGRRYDIAAGGQLTSSAPFQSSSTNLFDGVDAAGAQRGIFVHAVSVPDQPPVPRLESVLEWYVANLLRGVTIPFSACDFDSTRLDGVLELQAPTSGPSSATESTRSSACVSGALATTILAPGTYPMTLDVRDAEATVRVTRAVRVALLPPDLPFLAPQPPQQPLGPVAVDIALDERGHPVAASGASGPALPGAAHVARVTVDRAAATARVELDGALAWEGPIVPWGEAWWQVEPAASST